MLKWRPIPALRPRDMARFQKYLAAPDPETGCRRWLGWHAGKGYGYFYLAGINLRAHRVAYCIAYGPIPEGLELDHVKARGCRYRDCCEPSHLEAVDRSTNMRRGDTIAAVNAAKTHCLRGHPLIGANLKPWDQRRGLRSCKTCDRLRKREEYRAKIRATGREVKPHPRRPQSGSTAVP